MNFSALPELLLAWVKTQGAALLQGNKAEQASPFKVGSQYEGRVLDQLPNGRYLVQVASQKLDMDLPRNTQTGDAVRLTFLNAGPRPTFLLNSQGPVAPVQQVRLSSTAQQVSALMRMAQPAAQGGGQIAAQGATQAAALGTPPAPGQAVSQAAVAPPSAAMTAAVPSERPMNPMPASQASSAARPIVANVVMLQNAAAGAPNAPTAVASANTALLGHAVDSLRAAVPASTTLMPTVVADPAAPSANLLPSRLAQTVRESGLFYEAHLARWTKGVYPFESLLNEPQARLGRAAMPVAGMAELAGMPEEAARMAGRQLHMLEGGPFLWQGYAWPGQWMDWLVEERRQGEGGGRGGEEPHAWATELHLILPRMGSVHAQLSLRGREVGLRLQVAEAATAQAMTDALPDLHRGLEASGLHPVGLTVMGEAV
jgi:hypothetical protein